MILPKQKAIPFTRSFVRSFPGYHHAPVISAGECYDMKNLTGDGYPVLSARQPRTENLHSLDGSDVSQAVAMLGKEHLFIVNRDGTVCSNGHTASIGLETVTGYTLEVEAPPEMDPVVDRQTFLAAVSSEEGEHTFGYVEQDDCWYYRLEPVSLDTFGITIPFYHPEDRDTITVRVCAEPYIPADLLPKQLVSIGAVVCIWPDKCWVNAVELAAGEPMVMGKNCGRMEKTYDTDDYIVGGIGLSITIQPCKPDGTFFSGLLNQDTAPASAEDGDYWRDTSNQPYVIRQYNAATALWNPIKAYTGIQCQYLDTFFQIGDRVSFECYEDDERSTLVAGQDQKCEIKFTDREKFLVVVDGLCVTKTHHTVTTLTRLVAKLPVPKMDYIVECGNRLWGCYCGRTGGQYINEIYASALGDFRNWETLEGISTDAYTASRGSDGVFTGAAVLGGCPLFFKETCLEKVYPSAVGAHRIVTVDCDGIADGSWRSAVVIDGVLYYKAPNGVCQYTGSVPRHIDNAFGGIRFWRAVGGRQDKKYYLSMQDLGGVWHVFAYDTVRGLWYREDNTRFLCCADFHGVLYYADDKDRVCAIGLAGDETVSWKAESGLIGLSSPDHKYISRLDLRMALAPGTSCRVYVTYDDTPDAEYWILKDVIENTASSSLRTFTVPILPRRCDHMRLRLTGEGGWTLYSVGCNIEMGSDENV